MEAGEVGAGKGVISAHPWRWGVFLCWCQLTSHVRLSALRANVASVESYHGHSCRRRLSPAFGFTRDIDDPPQPARQPAQWGKTSHPPPCAQCLYIMISHFGALRRTDCQHWGKKGWTSLASDNITDLLCMWELLKNYCQTKWLFITFYFLAGSYQFISIERAAIAFSFVGVRKEQVFKKITKKTYDQRQMQYFINSGLCYFEFNCPNFSPFLFIFVHIDPPKSKSSEKPSKRIKRAGIDWLRERITTRMSEKKRRKW